MNNLLKANYIQNTTITATGRRELISREQLITDLTEDRLSEKECKSLAKGTKYSLQSQVDKNTIIDMTTSFCRLANQIYWKEIGTTSNPQADIITYPQSRYISKPEATTKLEI